MISYDNLLNIAQNPFSKENLKRLACNHFYDGEVKRELMAKMLRNENVEKFCDEVMVIANEKQ